MTSDWCIVLYLLVSILCAVNYHPVEAQGKMNSIDRELFGSTNLNNSRLPPSPATVCEVLQRNDKLFRCGASAESDSDSFMKEEFENFVRSKETDKRFKNRILDKVKLSCGAVKFAKMFLDDDAEYSFDRFHAETGDEEVGAAARCAQQRDLRSSAV